ncbi:hypothetical protein N658DRAFT_311745 [Parathielavia hyrcaniae]|uniref:Uncharacterized protein n=1 Tax=Parathielavia hyrcaniae TaxID=113614 RepID=A0AAN6PV09_9PEZI|nr:hypothetical protein N658DRAFT_311745 [Parathielavia hyrcaniae]
MPSGNPRLRTSSGCERGHCTSVNGTFKPATDHDNGQPPDMVYSELISTSRNLSSPSVTTSSSPEGTTSISLPSYSSSLSLLLPSGSLATSFSSTQSSRRTCILFESNRGRLNGRTTWTSTSVRT